MPTKLNKELIELGRECLTKNDRVALFERIGYDKESTLYRALQGKKNLKSREYDIIQKYITQKAKADKLI